MTLIDRIMPIKLAKEMRNRLKEELQSKR